MKDKVKLSRMKPTESGYYWYQIADRWPELVRVINIGGELYCEEYGIEGIDDVCDMNGFWSAKIVAQFDVVD